MTKVKRKPPPAEPLHEFFGRDENSYNLAAGDGSPGSQDGSGRPGINVVKRALFFWIGQQKGFPTVALTARVFRMPEKAVAHAIARCEFLQLVGYSTETQLGAQRIKACH